MGVTGLLPHLKEIQTPGTLERYRGTTLAIDTYGWLHRSVVSCAQELCMDIPTRKYITSILNKIDMLKYFGVTPYFVFDGAPLPTKSETNLERSTKRKQARKQAEMYMKQGKTKLAFKEFMKAASVTHAMAKSIMVELDNLGIKYVVAPYEADPQMVYLEKIGVVDGILSEDSDLLVFGCKRLITKLKDDGSCVEINRDDFGKVRSIPYLSSYTPEQLRLVAMLSGCDYTKGVNGIGIKSAFTLVRKYNNLDKIIVALQSDGKQVPEGFRDEVDSANLAFQYQKVFHPQLQKLMTLNEYPDSHDLDMEKVELCCGKTFDDETYTNLCNGVINPNTHELLVSREQSLTSLKSKSMTMSVTTTSTRTTVAATATPVCPHSDKTKRSILDMLAPRTPENRPFKRPKVMPQPQEVKLSPTSKKINKLTSSSPAEGKASKFFTKSTVSPAATMVSEPAPAPAPAPALAPAPAPAPALAPASVPVLTPAFDSSMLSDSEVPEDSSPLKVNTTSIEDILSDEDVNENEHHESSMNSNGFELSDDDEEEIEESSLNTSTTITQDYVSKFKVLRERFSCDSTYTGSVNVLKPRGTNFPTKQAVKSTEAVKSSSMTPVNTKTMTTSVKTTMSTSVNTTSIDIKQFAFKR
ncbi:uncharacterized protein SPAPADRAFT_50611 [Spathaspora passalidarum NRRL Y-27907]|uniref:Uncharacterized protein n=1 Tax=Spathaspora passalidarum (strain NRRL Y-27907 / 11-Y1) TaxID=619300 RepID=G3ANS3_SPAPN|nr:uncharacterized protein SPAPADRAFT_50611 [Spathaspora passalidarum NRRL Y-27907]EGW32008.1 hypothetical protein SPAPADRAFT_50611 [Spathaspora passalidarum NRRL Y-27907]